MVWLDIDGTTFPAINFFFLLLYINFSFDIAQEQKVPILASKISLGVTIEDLQFKAKIHGKKKA